MPWIRDGERSAETCATSGACRPGASRSGYKGSTVLAKQSALGIATSTQMCHREGARSFVCQCPPGRLRTTCVSSAPIGGSRWGHRQTLPAGRSGSAVAQSSTRRLPPTLALAVVRLLPGCLPGRDVRTRVAGLRGRPLPFGRMPDWVACATRSPATYTEAVYDPRIAWALYPRPHCSRSPSSWSGRCRRQIRTSSSSRIGPSGLSLAVPPRCAPGAWAVAGDRGGAGLPRPRP
jgi:hypothetical protein